MSCSYIHMFTHFVGAKVQLAIFTSVQNVYRIANACTCIHKHSQFEIFAFTEFVLTDKEDQQLAVNVVVIDVIPTLVLQGIIFLTFQT